MIKSIQILRAIAALLVVFLHFEFGSVRVGTFGVDIFFIISGFIITYLVHKDTRSFLYRRLVRIVPLYLSMTTFAAVLALVKPGWFRSIIVTVPAFIQSALFIPYKIQNSGPILSLGWTLNYEIFFYLIATFGITIWGGKRGMLASLVIILLFVLTYKVITPGNYALAFYSSNIVIEFIFGSLLYFFWKYNGPKGNQYIKNLFVVLGVISFVFMIYADQYLVMDRLLKFGIPSLFLANAFLLLEDKINVNNKFHKLGIVLGDASYAMYLIHPFIIYAFIRLLFKFIKSDSSIILILELLVTMVVVGFLSIVVHEKFEKPLIKIVKSLFDKRFDKKEKLIISDKN